jgi:hypothetical protein
MTGCLSPHRTLACAKTSRAARPQAIDASVVMRG